MKFLASAVLLFFWIFQQGIWGQEPTTQKSQHDHVLRGDDIASKGDYGKAIEEFRAAIRLDPSDANAHWHLARVLDGPLPDGKAINFYNLAVRYNKGNQDKALKEYQTALKLDPTLRDDGTESAERHSRHAAKYLGSNWGHWTSTWCGDFSDNWINHCMDNAVTEYRIALLMDPNYVPAHVGLGVVLEKLHKHDAAIEELRAALRVDPQSADAHLGLGHSLEKKGNLKDALQEYSQTLSLEEGRARYEKLSAKLGIKKEPAQPLGAETNAEGHLPAARLSPPTSAQSDQSSQPSQAPQTPAAAKPLESAPESKASAPEKLALPKNAAPEEILREFKSYYIKSDTIYLHRETLLMELEKRGQFSAWGLTPAEDSKAADVVITITLPFLTWEWNYKMVHQPTGAVLGTGKVSAAVEKTAAPQLAKMIVDRVRTARPLPASFQEVPNTPQALLNPKQEESKSWKVKYISGAVPGLPKDAPVTLTVSREWITVRSSNTISLSIPARNLTTADSRTEVHKATKGWDDFWDANFSCDNCPVIIFFAPVYLAGEGILAPMKATDHFVSMYWLEDGAGKGAEFRVSGGDAKSLLAELKRITGREVEDLQQISEARRREITKRYYSSPIIETNREVMVGWRKLAAGGYRLVAIRREDHLAEVYFFDGKFKGGKFAAEDVAAYAVAELESRKALPGSNTPPSISYGEQNGLVTFSHIETDEFVLRFTPIPLGFAK